MTAEFDFIIIGSGVLGCLAYDFLASRDSSVLLISEENFSDNDNYITQTGIQTYLGVSKGRKKGLGGTSQLWGGAMNINYEKAFIEECQSRNINFDIEQKRIFNFFGIKNLKSNLKKKIYSSKKYTIYEEIIVWPSFAKRNVFKNIRKKYQDRLNLIIGSYKKVEKVGEIFRIFIQTESNKLDIFTCKKVIFCMGFFDNIGTQLKNEESYKFKEHLSSQIGVISNTENFPLSPSLQYKINHFKTKRYEIYDNEKRKSVGFLHLSNTKSEFLIKFRDLLICLQSFKVPPIKLIYDLLKLSHQIIPIIKNILLNDGDISNNKSKSSIHLVIDKEDYSYIKKSSNRLEVDWNISDIDIKMYNNLKSEINKIIDSLIDQSSPKFKSYLSSKTVMPQEIFHPFSGHKKQNCKCSDYIWSGTHALAQLGSLSPTVASHFLKMKEYENARKNMCNYSNQK